MNEDQSRVRRLEIQMDLVLDRLSELKERYEQTGLVFETVRLYAKRYEQIRNRLSDFASDLEDVVCDIRHEVGTIADLCSVLRSDLDGLTLEELGAMKLDDENEGKKEESEP